MLGGAEFRENCAGGYRSTGSVILGVSYYFTHPLIFYLLTNLFFLCQIFVDGTSMIHLLYTLRKYSAHARYRYHRAQGKDKRRLFLK
jgi:hypothetical protein